MVLNSVQVSFAISGYCATVAVYTVLSIGMGTSRPSWTSFEVANAQFKMAAKVT